MRYRGRTAHVLVLAGVLISCAGTPAPTSPAPSPSTPQLSPRPLPPNLVPRPGDLAVQVSAGTPPADPQLTYRFTLEHCGIFSPIDFDASLWDPVGASNATGGPIDEMQEGELINATDGQIRLVDRDAAQFRTASGLVLFLARHDGPKRYPGCA